MAALLFCPLLAKGRYPVRNIAPIDPMLIRAPEAAKLLNLSERTVWTLTKERKVPFVRIGRSIRYSPEALRAWITDRQRESFLQN